MKRIQCVFTCFVCGTLLLALGCQQARISGRDPLLGKMRVDPPATSARSVYVERKDVQDGGLLPSETTAIVNAPAASAKEKEPSRRAEAIQTASEKRVTVQKVPVEAALASHADPQENTSEELKENGNVSAGDSSHLRWRAVETSATLDPGKVSVPQTRQTGDARRTSAQVRELTEEELANYRYAYDFTTIPPRKVPLSSTKGSFRGSEFYQEPGVCHEQENAQAETAGTVSVPSVRASSRSFYANDFDPYAPCCEFDRRRQEVSRRFEMEFDAPETEMKRTEQTQTERMTAGSEASEPISEVPFTVKTTRPETISGGWRVVAGGRAETAKSASGLESASIHERLGGQVQVDLQNASAGTKTPSETGGETVPRVRKKHRSVELLDLRE